VGGSTGADVAQKVATEAADDHASRDERGKPRWRVAARLAMVAILAGMVTIYHRDLFRSFGALRHLSGRWFVLAAAAEMASVLSFAFSRRRLLSASGRSENVLAAAHRARSKGLTVWAMTGPAPNPLAGLADEALCVAGADTSVVQEVHLVAIHTLCDALDAEIAVVMAP